MKATEQSLGPECDYGLTVNRVMGPPSHSFHHLDKILSQCLQKSVRAETRFQFQPCDVLSRKCS